MLWTHGQCRAFIALSNQQKCRQLYRLVLSPAIAGAASLFLYFYCPQAEAMSQSPAQVRDSLRSAYASSLAKGNDTLAILTLNALCKALWGTYPDSAMTIAQKMLAEAERCGFQRGIGMAYNNIAYIHRKQSRYEECLTYSRKAIDILEPLGDRTTVAWCYHNIGNVYYARGRFDLALEHHLKALKLRELLGAKIDIAWSLSNIGDIYRDQGYKEQSLEYAQKAIRLFQEVQDKHGMAVAMNSIGAILQGQGKYDSAKSYFMQALALDEESEHGIGIIWSSRFCGELELLRGRYAEARRYFEYSLEVCRRVNDPHNEAVSLRNLAIVHLRQNNMATAFEYARAALRRADSIGSRSIAQNILELLAELYATSGNYQAAYHYHKQFASLRDSLFSGEAAKKIAELNALYDAERREREIEILTKDKALHEAEIRSNTWTRNVLIAGVVVLLVIAILLVQRYRLVERARAALGRKNAAIMRQQQILEDQASEIEVTNTQLHEQNLLLQQLNIEKNEFLGIAAHDLKNPLTAITMTASGLRDYPERFSREQARERLSGIITASQHMASIISNLLDINAIETGNLNISCKPTAILPILRHTVQEYEDRAAAKRITIEFESLRDFPSPVLSDDIKAMIDAGTTTEILDNLISNAIKYSPFDKRVLVRLSVTEEWVRVEVQDEGPGVSEEDKVRMFGKFARLSAQPTGGEHSTGLGLSIVKRFTEAMKGRIRCESRLGDGATFIVEFPRA